MAFDDDLRPAPPARAGGRGWPALLRWAAAATAAVVVVVSGVIYLGFQHYSGKLRRIDNVFPATGRPAQSAAGSENFLLVGSDNRDQLSKADQRKYHLGHDPGRRSDTMIILHISKKRDRAELISLPRDSYVKIPAYWSGGRKHPAQHNKLNAAYAFGGPRLTVETVERATGIRIDHYVEINVLGFAHMVDALGGIDVCLPKAANDPDSGLHLPAGHSHVGGVQGLAFVRARHTLGDGSDLGRIKRQQQFLGAMLRKALSAGILLNPAKLDNFLNAALAAVHVDRDLTTGDLRTLALTMRHLDPKHVLFATVPLSDTNYDVPGVGSSVLWNTGLADAMFKDINRDVPITTALFKPGKVTVPPTSVTVQVLNGTTTGGLAGRVSQELAAEGFHISGTGNASSHATSHTTVRYGPGELKRARTVKAALPGATVVSDPSAGSSIVVVLGRDFTGVQKVVVGSSRSSGSAIQTSTAADNPCKSS